MENFVCFLFVVFYNVVLFGMAIIDEGDFDLFADRYNLKRHGVYSALNSSFLVWGIYNLVKFPSHDKMVRMIT